MTHTERATIEPLGVEGWTKIVKPEWRTWCGNILPEEVPAISDGFSLFLEETSDPKRYEKLKDERSYRCDHPEELALDTTYAEPLTLDAVFDVDEWVRERLDQKGGRMALKYVARFAQQRGPVVYVNAQRLRCAMLMCKGKHCWLGEDGKVYVTGKADTGMDLFGEAPPPLAAIAPLNSKRAFEIENYVL